MAKTSLDQLPTEIIEESDLRELSKSTGYKEVTFLTKTSLRMFGKWLIFQNPTISAGPDNWESLRY